VLTSVDSVSAVVSLYVCVTDTSVCASRWRRERVDEMMTAADVDTQQPAAAAAAAAAARAARRLIPDIIPPHEILNVDKRMTFTIWLVQHAAVSRINM